jgi:hypothetical protein
MDEKDNPRSKQYDHSWDDDDFDDNDEALNEDEEENDPLDRKMEQWDKRDWQKWLRQYVTFPFTATREEDMDANPFSEEEDNKPFAVGSKMTVTEFGYNDFHETMMAHVKQGKNDGWVPLADLEVTPKSDPNYWAVREYVVWFANR